MKNQNNEHNDHNEPEKTIDEAESIDLALIQMGMIYKSRCIQPPRGSNITIREIKEEDECLTPENLSLSSVYRG
jgi:hypothetical protein